jgi:hypothetical protein
MSLPPSPHPETTRTREINDLATLRGACAIFGLLGFLGPASFFAFLTLPNFIKGGVDSFRR